MSSEVSSHSDLVTWEFTPRRLDDQIVWSSIGEQLSNESSDTFPGLDDNLLRETWVGFQSLFEVDWMWGQCGSSSEDGARDGNWILVPAVVSGMIAFSCPMGPVERGRDSSKGLSQQSMPKL